MITWVFFFELVRPSVCACTAYIHECVRLESWGSVLWLDRGHCDYYRGAVFSSLKNPARTLTSASHVQTHGCTRCCASECAKTSVWNSWPSVRDDGRCTTWWCLFVMEPFATFLSKALLTRAGSLNRYIHTLQADAKMEQWMGKVDIKGGRKGSKARKGEFNLSRSVCAHACRDPESCTAVQGDSGPQPIWRSLSLLLLCPAGSNWHPAPPTPPTLPLRLSCLSFVHLGRSLGKTGLSETGVVLEVKGKEGL